MKVGPKRKSSTLATSNPILIDQRGIKHRIPRFALGSVASGRSIAECKFCTGSGS